MATYAAYRHVELDKIGYGKRRVLKPPGGGTSDLFTPSDLEEAPKSRIPQSISPVSHEHPSASNGIEKSGDADEDEPEIVIEPEMVGDVPVIKVKEPKKYLSSISRNCVTGDGCQTEEHFAIRVHRQRDGNPVTGEGYDLAKSASASSNSAAPAAPSKTRVPPGGYSSGLW